MLPTKNDRALEEQANKLLRSNGFTWAGRSQSEVTSKLLRQKRFEGRMVTVQTMGKSRR